jgi:YHS domain-containing protein
MNSKKKQFRTALLLAGVLLLGLFILQGRKKEPEPAPPPEPGGVAFAKIEQTTCPVMGGAINKSMFTEYKGKKVYFCCAGCKDKFEKEPEKYLAKLPQFKK